MEIHDVVGGLGAFIILGAYGALQLGRLAAGGWRYSVANGFGAALVLYSLAHEFNLSAFLVEAFWLAISLVGIVRFLRQRRNPGA